MMDFSTAKSERITAILSTLVAIAILAGGVTAYQASTAPVSDIEELESDLRFQLEVAYKHDPSERAKRLDALQHVTHAWLQSPQSDSDRQLLADWLLEATVRSMPGSQEALPTAPDFSKDQPVAALPTEVMIVPPVAEPSHSLSQDAEPTLVEAVPEPIESAAPEQISQEPALPVATVSVPAEPIERPQPTENPAPAYVPINLAELTARIAGYHEGLSEVETELIALEHHDVQTLARLIRQVDELARAYRFVQLYYGALSDEERLIVRAPHSLNSVLKQISQELDRSEVASPDDFLEEFDAQHQPADLDDLRRALASIAQQLQ